MAHLWMSYGFKEILVCMSSGFSTPTTPAPLSDIPGGVSHIYSSDLWISMQTRSTKWRTGGYGMSTPLIVPSLLTS